MLVIALQREALLVALLVRQNEDEVNECPDTHAPEGEQLEQSGTDLAQIEAVDAEYADEQGEQPGHQEGLVAYSVSAQHRAAGIGCRGSRILAGGAGVRLCGHGCLPEGGRLAVGGGLPVRAPGRRGPAAAAAAAVRRRGLLSSLGSFQRRPGAGRPECVMDAGCAVSWTGSPVIRSRAVRKDGLARYGMLM